VNDLTSANGPGPGGTGLRAWYPTTTIRAALNGGGNVVLTFGGILQAATDVNGPFTDVPGASSPYIVTPSQPQQFFRIRLPN